MSESKAHDAFQKALVSIGAASKDGNNPHFRSSYATLEACNAVVKPACKENGLALNHRIKFVDGTLLVSTTVKYGGVLLDESLFPLMNTQNEQKAGSAITYGKRYNICCLFNLDTTDDDGNTAVAPSGFQKPVSKPPVKNKAGKCTDGQKKALWAISRAKNIDLKKHFNVQSSDEISFEDASAFISEHNK
jgi:hypothetical protein